jgi:hypothetical protein
MAVKGQKSGLDRTQNPDRSGKSGGDGGSRRFAERPLGGAVPSYDHPSAGQVISGLGNALALGTGSVAGLIGGVASADAYGRSLFGRTLDNLTGGVPEAPSRWSVPPSSPNLDTRGEKSNLLDGQRSRVTATIEAAGAQPGSGSGEESPDIVLRDRRRPISLYAGTDLLARRA